MMSLGAGALKVSGEGRRANAISREQVSMATLAAGTTPKAATKRHRHTEEIQCRYLPKRMLTKPPRREGGEEARIRNDSQ